MAEGEQFLFRQIQAQFLHPVVVIKGDPWYLRIVPHVRIPGGPVVNLVTLYQFIGKQSRGDTFGAVLAYVPDNNILPGSIY